MKRATYIVLVTLVFATAAALGIALEHATWNISSMWPANGLVIGLLYAGRRTPWLDILFAVLLGSLSSNVLLIADVPSALIFSLGNVVEGMAVAFALRLGTPVSAVSNPLGLARFLFQAALVPAAVSAVFVAALSRAISGWPLNGVAASWLNSDALGLAIFLPLGYFVRSAYRAAKKSYARRAIPTRTLLRQCGIGIIAHVVILTASVLIFRRAHSIAAYWALPPLVIGILWTGSYAAVTGTCLIAAVAAVSTMGQPMNSAGGEVFLPAQAIAEVQGFTLACMLTAYLMAAMLSDRQRYLRHATRRHRTQRRLADDLRVANEELDALAHTDPLTGVANRRQFEIALHEAMQHSAKTGRPLGLIFIDVDWFKLYNDCYGHQKGDEALYAVATALRSGLPARTTVARVGGEEFAIVWTDADVADLIEFGHDAVRRVVDLRLPHRGSAYGCVSVSVGMVAAPCSPVTIPAELLAKADAAMYFAKQQGRNRAIFCPQERLYLRNHLTAKGDADHIRV